MQIVFEDDEHLVQVTGTEGQAYGTLTVVTSLTLISNKRSYGPYGKEESGTRFQTLPNGRVLGFYGRCGGMVDELGAFVAQPSLPVEAFGNADEAWGGPGGSLIEFAKMSLTFNEPIYRVSFVQTSTQLPKMHQKLTKHGRGCKQNNQLPTKSHDELEDNSIVCGNSM